MFGFLSMMGNHEQRKVENTVIGKATIDTCEVYDSNKPFETGIAHPDYNGGNWVIVELYQTRELAQKGHKKWVKIFSGKLPSQLKDVNECELHLLAVAMGGSLQKICKRKQKAVAIGAKTNKRKLGKLQATSRKPRSAASAC